jgi:hypothetical protein
MARAGTPDGTTATIVLVGVHEGGSLAGNDSSEASSTASHGRRCDCSAGASIISLTLRSVPTRR